MSLSILYFLLPDWVSRCVDVLIVILINNQNIFKQSGHIYSNTVTCSIIRHSVGVFCHATKVTGIVLSGNGLNIYRWFDCFISRSIYYMRIRCKFL